MKSSLIAVVLVDDNGSSSRPPLMELFHQPANRDAARFEPDTTVARWVDQHQHPLVIPSAAEEDRFPRTTGFMKRHGIQSSCTLSLRTVHRRLGNLTVGSTRFNAYPEDEVRFLELVADEVAVAIDDTLNLEALRTAQVELQNERNRLKLLLDFTTAVASSLELEDVARAIAEHVRRVLPCDGAGVALPENESRQLRVYAFDFPGAESVPDDGTAVPADSTSGKASRSREVWVGDLNDAVKSAPVKDPFQVSAIRSTCLLPLVSGKRVLGLLAVGRRPEAAFHAEELDFLTHVAQQTAIAVENALAYGQVNELKDKLTQEKLYLEDEIQGGTNYGEIVGESPLLRQALQLLETVAPTDSTVLLLGETGTGKELLARAIHNKSLRKHRTFVKLNCAAIPTGLLESELFGHERGAFTGAIAQKIGRLELANRGTLFLDEIGDIPLELQPKLLRALQDREFERLGSTTTLKSNARLIAATNRNLDKMIADRQFRSDLYYRLNVFPIGIPALRDRPGDVPLLVRHFTRWHSRRMNKSIRTVPVGTMKRLSEAYWPGNVRELENLIERAVILTQGSVLNLSPSDLADTPRGNGSAARRLAERDRVLRVLKETRGRIGGPGGAAVRLGLKRTTLSARLKTLGIDPRALA